MGVALLRESAVAARAAPHGLEPDASPRDDRLEDRLEDRLDDRLDDTRMLLVSGDVSSQTCWSMDSKRCRIRVVRVPGLIVLRAAGSATTRAGSRGWRSGWRSGRRDAWAWAWAWARAVRSEAEHEREQAQEERGRA